MTRRKLAKVGEPFTVGEGDDELTLDVVKVENTPTGRTVTGKDGTEVYLDADREVVGISRPGWTRHFSPPVGNP